MLEKRIVKCPKCSAVFTVTNPNKEERIKIKCYNGNCLNEMTVLFDDGRTILPEVKASTNIGSLIVTSQEISLDEWTNKEYGDNWTNVKFTLGRASMTPPKPDIGIITADHTMSRIHCNVEIRKLESGRKKTIISDARNKEKIEKCSLDINGIALYPADRIVLCDGNNIKMGKTVVRFSQK